MTDLIATTPMPTADHDLLISGVFFTVAHFCYHIGKEIKNYFTSKRTTKDTTGEFIAFLQDLIRRIDAKLQEPNMTDDDFRQYTLKKYEYEAKIKELQDGKKH